MPKQKWETQGEASNRNYVWGDFQISGRAMLDGTHWSGHHQGKEITRGMDVLKVMDYCEKFAEALAGEPTDAG